MKTYFILLLLIFCQIVIFSSIKLTKVNKNRGKNRQIIK